ncbi:unnamed protein product [Ranitomeya imitator]|uniref:Helix-turn-helix domain-containing protein n=1 Tax=Ranitomeya imitator TaxID=111125 RepID=A0ABN9L6S3_9NEOB|nr:unnamed protein product [Ranitomeya imitator]
MRHREEPEFSSDRIAFLDVLVFKGKDNCLQTDLYRKTTAVNSFLHASSSHPPAMIRAIPIGQFLRLRRICSTDEDFEKQAMDLKLRFVERGYSRRSIKKAYNRAKNTTRHQALYSSKPGLTSNQSLTIRFVLDVSHFGRRGLVGPFRLDFFAGLHFDHI